MAEHVPRHMHHHPPAQHALKQNALDAVKAMGEGVGGPSGKDDDDVDETEAAGEFKPPKKTRRSVRGKPAAAKTMPAATMKKPAAAGKPPRPAGRPPRPADTHKGVPIFHGRGKILVNQSYEAYRVFPSHTAK